MDELYLSRSEIASLKQRIDDLEKQRLEVAQEIREAKAQGDLRENAAYHAAKEKQAFLESQIRELERRLGQAKPLDDDGHPQTVRSGTIVQLRDLERDEELEVYVVADLSLAPPDGPMPVSSQSPLGAAIIGYARDNEVTVDSPSGAQRYRILDIQSAG
ncbi:MAG: GreA/GreB family elongation factor [Candidatus Bipolaricaulia bacterium]